MNVIDGCFPLAQGVAQRFDRNVNSNLVAVFETVSHSFGRAVDPNRNSLDDLRVDSFEESPAGEPNHAERGSLDRWFVRLEVDRHPNLVRILCCQTVEPKRRQEAHDAPGHKFGSKGQCVMFRDGRIGECVHAASGPHEEPLSVKAEQKLASDSQRLNIARTDQRLARGET